MMFGTTRKTDATLEVTLVATVDLRQFGPI